MSGVSSKPKSIIKIAYDTYCDHVHWQQPQDDPPPWHKLSNLHQEAWTNAVLAVFEVIRQQILDETEEE